MLSARISLMIFNLLQIITFSDKKSRAFLPRFNVDMDAIRFPTRDEKTNRRGRTTKNPYRPCHPCRPYRRRGRPWGRHRASDVRQSWPRW